MRLPRWAVPTVGVLVVGGALASRSWNESKEHEKARVDALEGEQAGIKVTARLGEPCAGETPVRITVKNTTTRTLTSVAFHLGVYEAGRIGDLDPSAPDEAWTLTLAPGAEESRCGAATVRVDPRHVLRAERRNEATFREKGARAR